MTKYFLKRTKNGFEATLAEKKKGIWTVATWTAKPKTYTTSHYETKELNVDAQEVQRDEFTIAYLYASKFLKWRANGRILV